MPKPRKSAFEAVIRRKIEELRATESKCTSRYDRDRFIPYLEKVFELLAEIRKLERKKWRIARRTLREMSLTKRERRSKSTIRLILDATSAAPLAKRSLWKIALSYLRQQRKKVAVAGFATFLEDNGGIIGCANAYRASKQKKSRTAGSAKTAVVAAQKAGSPTEKSVDEDEDDWDEDDDG